MNTKITNKLNLKQTFSPRLIEEMRKGSGRNTTNKSVWTYRREYLSLINNMRLETDSSRFWQLLTATQQNSWSNSSFTNPSRWFNTSGGELFSISVLFVSKIVALSQYCFSMWRCRIQMNSSLNYRVFVIGFVSMISENIYFSN